MYFILNTFFIKSAHTTQNSDQYAVDTRVYLGGDLWDDTTSPRRTQPHTHITHRVTYFVSRTS